MQNHTDCCNPTRVHNKEDEEKSTIATAIATALEQKRIKEETLKSLFPMKNGQLQDVAGDVT